jgi:hypothetical protein
VLATLWPSSPSVPKDKRTAAILADQVERRTGDREGIALVELLEDLRRGDGKKKLAAGISASTLCSTEWMTRKMRW